MESTVGLQSPCNAVHISLSGGYLIPHKLPAFSFLDPGELVLMCHCVYRARPHRLTGRFSLSLLIDLCAPIKKAWIGFQSTPG